MAASNQPYCVVVADGGGITTYGPFDSDEAVLVAAKVNAHAPVPDAADYRAKAMPLLPWEDPPR